MALYKEGNGNRDFQRAIYDDWNSSRARALYRDGSCSRTIWRVDLSNVEMKPLNP